MVASDEPLMVTLPVPALKVPPALFVKAASFQSMFPDPPLRVAPEAFVQAAVDVTEAP